MYKKLMGFLSFPVDESYKAELNKKVEEEYYKGRFLIGFIIIAFQLFMILFAFYRQTYNYSPRRVYYIILYATLLLASLIVLFMTLSRRKRGVSSQNLFLLYSLVISFWSCGISILDSYRSTNISVYSYVLMSVSVFCLLTPKQSAFVYLANFVLLNSVTYIFSANVNMFATPPGLFSLVINSVFVTVFSFIISCMLYRYRIISQYNRILLKSQYNEILKINKELDLLAQTDQLTQMGNRRFLENKLINLIKNEEVNSKKAVGMMIDIDFFKQYNDLYGHMQGDICLKLIASEIIKFANEIDAFVARYGGEEFFLFYAGNENGAEMAQKIKKLIQDQNIPHANAKEGCVTISIGVSTEENLQLVGHDEFISHCDKALYKAKSSGRNCVCVYSDIA